MNSKTGDLIDGNKEEISKEGKIMINIIKENNDQPKYSGKNVEENGQEIVEGKCQ